MLKNITVKTKFDETTHYLMIESEEDLDQYIIQADAKIQNKIASVLRSGEPPNRWDHLITKTAEGAALCCGYMEATLEGGNPLLLMGKYHFEKANRFRDLISQGEIILVNSSGGYCSYAEDYHTIVEETPYEIPKDYVINKGTKYINLENDPELEKHTIDYLSQVDPNYSYITNLAIKSTVDLEGIFSEFVQAGGDTVYVYTTGMNVQQMYDYMNAAIACGIDNFEFEFNAGIDDDIQEFLDNYIPLVNLTHKG